MGPAQNLFDKSGLRDGQASTRDSGPRCPTFQHPEIDDPNSALMWPHPWPHALAANTGLGAQRANLQGNTEVPPTGIEPVHAV
jgi:hypothetical protein